MTTSDRHTDLPGGGASPVDPSFDQAQPDPGYGGTGDMHPPGAAVDGREARVDQRPTEDPDGREQMVSAERANSYSSRWNDVKGVFVDEPRQAVAQADELVGELLGELEQLFREQRRSIEQGLDADETSTEDLRQALRRYRSFFDRLLSF